MEETWTVPSYGAQKEEADTDIRIKSSVSTEENPFFLVPGDSEHTHIATRMINLQIRHRKWIRNDVKRLREYSVYGKYESHWEGERIITKIVLVNIN